MFYKNARIFTPDFRFHTGAFEVRNGLFGEILPENVPADAVDLNGATVIPGLIDVHSHGNSGADFSDGDYEGLKRMAAFYAKCGVTSFAPASMTLPYDTLETAFRAAVRLHRNAPARCARLLGIQMEGPFFSERKKGAQNAADEQSQRHRPDAEAKSDDEPPDQEAGLVAAGRAADKEIRQFRPAPAIGGYGFRTPQEKAGSQKQQDDQNGVHPPERGEKPPLPTVLGIGRPFAPERLPGAAGAHRSCASQSVVLNQK